LALFPEAVELQRALSELTGSPIAMGASQSSR
jgi:hypothetical protein